MNKNKFRWLGLCVLVTATLFVMGGCGGGSSSTSSEPAVAKVSGTVTFPTAASVSINSLGKHVPKSVSLLIPVTIELRDLTGKRVATTTAVASTTGTYEYEFTDVPIAYYIVKAVRGNTVMKALVEKNTFSEDTTKTRNVDAVSTTAVIVTEKKLGVTPGTIGEPVTPANAAKFTPELIAGFNSEVIFNSIMNAIGTVTGDNPASASADDIKLVNLINIVAASVVNDVNPAGIITNTVTAPPVMTTKQYTTANVSTGGTTETIIQDNVAATFTATNYVYVAPPVGGIAYSSRIMDYSGTAVTVAPALAGGAVTTIGLSPEIKTFTDPNGHFTLVGIPKNTNFIIKMGKYGSADTYSAQLSCAVNTDTSGSPFSVWSSAKLTTDWGNTPGTGVIRASVVESTNLVTGYMAGVVVTATDAAAATVTYPVIYLNQATHRWDTALASTDTNGVWMFKNVPAGRTVNVTATKAGYAFNMRTYKIVADAVCQGHLTGTKAAEGVVVQSLTVSPSKAALQTGLYEFKAESSQTSPTGQNAALAKKISKTFLGF